MPTRMLLTSLHPRAVAGGADIPNAVAIGDLTLSRSDLVGGATAVAERIHGLERLAVLAEPTVTTVLAVLGALIAGVTVVPVPPDSGGTERAHIITDSGAQAWLGAAPADPSLPVIPVRTHARSWHSFPEPDSAHTALIMYTSGTTGAPKGVVVSRRAIAAGLDALIDAWAWTPDDTLVHGLPLFHLHGLVLGVLGPLRVGSPLVHTGRPSPEAYAAAAGSMYFGVPTVWSRIVESPTIAAELAGARLLISGSAPLPPPVFQRIAAIIGHAPVERYGMTETGITVSVRHDSERRPGWVGLPVAGVRTRLTDNGGLEVNGPMLFDGYLNRPDATAEAWTDDGWFRTGDVAEVDPDGMHRIIGRESTDLIKSGGYRIGAGEVESALLTHPAVAEAAVVGASDNDLGQRVVAYVVLRDPIPEAVLIAHVAETLSAHKRPREIRIIDALPRNAMGKVQKKLLS